jgi:formylglycine-generating enzyme required for sulfatase activity
MSVSSADSKASHFERHEPMKLHYQVRSVLLSHNSSAVTLEPILWMRESATLTEPDDEGNMVPTLVEIEGDPRRGDEPMAVGGAKTELRFDEVTGLVPGEYVTVAFGRTLPD